MSLKSQVLVLHIVVIAIANLMGGVADYAYSDIVCNPPMESNIWISTRDIFKFESRARNINAPKLGERVINPNATSVDSIRKCETESIFGPTPEATVPTTDTSWIDTIEFDFSMNVDPADKRAFFMADTVYMVQCEIALGDELGCLGFSSETNHSELSMATNDSLFALNLESMSRDNKEFGGNYSEFEVAGLALTLGQIALIGCLAIGTCVCVCVAWLVSNLQVAFPA